MDDNLLKINRTLAITDTLMCVTSILAFAFAGWFFGRWWVNLFSLIPLLLFSSHTMILDAEFAAQKFGKDAPEEDIECMKVQDGDYDDNR